jgi:hypothetical protein
MYCGQKSEILNVKESRLQAVNWAVPTGLCYPRLGNVLLPECGLS